MIELLQAGVEAIPQQQQMTMSLFSLFLQGGVLMWVLLALSIVAIYLIGKKWWMISKAGKIDRNFMNNIDEMIHEGKFKTAAGYCAKTNCSIARLVRAGIEKYGSSPEDIQKAIENTGNAEVAKLESGLPVLATIAGGAPMIGFLGTVVGMVRAFFNMSQAGNNIDITMLSGGIYLAMMTTVGGLIVGIIAYFGYNYLSSLISNLVTKMDDTTFKTVEILKTKAEEGKSAAVGGRSVNGERKSEDKTATGKNDSEEDKTAMGKNKSGEN